MEQLIWHAKQLTSSILILNPEKKYFKLSFF